MPQIAFVYLVRANRITKKLRVVVNVNTSAAPRALKENFLTLMYCRDITIFSVRFTFKRRENHVENQSQTTLRTSPNSLKRHDSDAA